MHERLFWMTFIDDNKCSIVMSGLEVEHLITFENPQNDYSDISRLYQQEHLIALLSSPSI